MFVSRYQLPTFPLPLFVSGSKEPINFTDNFTTPPADIHQSLKALTYVKGNNNRLNDKLFELGIRKTGSKSTKRANRKRAKKRKEGKLARKPKATPNKPNGTNRSSKEFHDNEFTNYLSNLMAQVDSSLQAELEKIRNDDYGINIEEVKPRLLSF